NDKRSHQSETTLQAQASILLGTSSKVPVAERNQIEGDVRGRRLRSEQLDPRSRRVDPQQQRIEIEPVRSGDHDLPVHHAAPWKLAPERLLQLREVAVERFQIAALPQ